MRAGLTTFDPTDPECWPAQQARGRESFQLLYGLPVGVLAAVLYDLTLLVARHDVPLFFSAQHAMQLFIIMISVGPVAGLIVGRMLWRIGERRYGDAVLTREFLGDSGNATRVPQRSPGMRPGHHSAVGSRDVAADGGVERDREAIPAVDRDDGHR